MTARVAVAAFAVAAALTPAPATHAEPLTLADAVRLARSRHPVVEAQRGQVLAARGRGEQALAPLLPYLTGNLSYQPQTANIVPTPSLARTLLGNSGNDTVLDTAGLPTVVSCRNPGVGNCTLLGGQPTSWQLHDFWTMGVGANWTLWDWGRSLYGLRAAHAQTAAAETGVVTAQRDVGLGAAVAFFAALAAGEQLGVARDAVATYTAHLEQTRAFHDNGLRTGIDVATAESALASAAITLARAEAGLASSRAQLAQAIGADRDAAWTLTAPSDVFDITPADAERVASAPETLTARAWAQRSELRQLGFGERANLATMRSARAQYLPALALDVGATWAGQHWDNLAGNLTIGLALSYPLGGMSPLWVHGAVRAAAGDLVSTQAQARQVRDTIRQETVTARAQLASARSELSAARTLVDAAKRQRALAEGRYQTGVGNVIELYDALLTDVNARFQLVQARLDVATARAQLSHALGEDP